MIDRLREIENRFDTVNGLLCSPDIATDIEKSAALQKELKNLAPVVEKYREYKKNLSLMEEAEKLMSGAQSDRDFKLFVSEEYETAKSQSRKNYDELRLLLLPKDKDDDKNVIVEIRSSAGGEESALFAATLFRMYSMYAENKGWKTDVIYESPTELGGFREISFTVKGTGAYSRLKFESGVHRVQRIPVTESTGRIQTSTATVAVLPEAGEVDVKIDPADLQIDAFHSSGAGGQHVNKTSSAIRITHIPTGTVVECQDERSQYRNKDKAMNVLRSRLYKAELEKQESEIAGTRRLQVGSGDRSERIRTYNFPQGRVTDHRIGLTLYKLDSVINGNLDVLFDALMTADTADRLKNSGEENL